MRSVGLDVHRDFCEVAIIDPAGGRARGRVASTREALQLFAQSLAPSDRVALEVGKGGDNLVPAILGESAERDDGDALRESAKEEFLAIARARSFRVYDGALALLDALRARGLRLALATS